MDKCHICGEEAIQLIGVEGMLWAYYVCGKECCEDEVIELIGKYCDGIKEAKEIEHE